MPAAPLPIEIIERRMKALAEYNGNFVHAAKALGISRGALQNTVASQALWRGGPSPTGHAGRIDLEIDDGVILVGSDAHVMPGEPTTAMYAFECAIKHFKKELRAVILNGDVLDGATISRHPSIGWEKKPTLIEELTAVQEQLARLRDSGGNGPEYIWTLGNHDCLDSETECLTQRGWIGHDELCNDDLILSLANGASQWSPIDEIVRFPFDGDLIRVEKTRLSMAITENHRVLLRRLNWRTSKYDIEEYRRADDLPYSFNLPMAAPSGNSDWHGLTDDQLSLAGWILTDGHFLTESGAIEISQGKPAGILEIDGLLDRLGVPHTRRERWRDIKEICGRELKTRPLPSVEFYIKAEQGHQIRSWLPDKRLPEWVMLLSDRQFDVLLSAFVAGNGCWDGAKDGRCAVLYGRPEILCSLQAAAVAHGWRARFAIDNRGDPRLCLSKDIGLRVEKPHRFRERYTGTVWCLRVPHGNFMVRRKGCAYFTGNSRFETTVANKLPEFRKINGVHLHDHVPGWQNAWSCWINHDIVVKHRFRGGAHAGWNNTIHSGKTIVTGHTHQLGVTSFTDYSGTRWGIQTGTLSEPYSAPFIDYTEANPVNWRAGFVILTIRDGRLLQPELVDVISPTEWSFRGMIYERH
jgi:hypothetical protein